ncbi:probable vamp-like protein at1g33475 [Phtheirospermum japonicum]|uniref:Probable vamp-like protein at1g33475 n=1 Tax=Phtheirospermum japonicum TaxID=374723 RepID=A0A830DIF0_9LAMI|nr:probable vamp-like protein at1g33475 [Phtheirospermum japonicum]
MASVGNTVSYCCIWKKGGRVLYTYKNGGHEIANLALSCLEMTPPYHRWYFQTAGKHTFGFLIDNEYVYFAIVYESLGNSHVLRFLQKLRDEFGRVGDKRGSTKTVSSLDSLCLQEHLFPVVLRLVASLEQHVKQEWPDNSNGNNTHVVDDGVASSTKAPLLGKPSKQDKKKMKDDHVAVAIEMEEHRRSTDRGHKIDHGASSSSSSQSTRINKLSSQNLQKKWCRRVWIVLAIDAAVCVVLFIIWLFVCHGTECIR